MQNIPTVLQQFIEKTNSADSEAFVALFAADGSVNDWGNVYKGTAQIASWNQSDNISKHSHFELVNSKQQSEDKWMLDIKVTGSGFNGTSPIEFTLVNDKIQSMMIVPD